MRRHLSNSDPMPVSEAELTAMTADLVDAHAETLPRLREAISSMRIGGDATDRGGFSRRSFLRAGGLLGIGGVALVAAGPVGASTVARAGARPATSMSPSTDVVVAALAASLENLAVSTYSSALSAAGAGKLGTVPAAIATFAKTARSQHADHAAAWNAIVKSAGYRAITAPNAVVAKGIDQAFAKVTDVAGVASLALTLEDAAAATYLEAIEVVSGRTAIETAATIQPVEMEHAAILHFVLGTYPVPAAFATLSGAVPPKDAPKLTRA